MRAVLRIVTEPIYSHKVKLCLCTVANCSKKTPKKYRMCYKHKREKQKLENPLSYWYDVLRQNARSRGIDFNLPKSDFKIFCDRTNYLEKKGKNAGGYSIDRIKSHIGYQLDNLQVLTLSQNSRKRWIDLKIQFGRYPTDEELAEFIEASKLPENPEPQINIIRAIHEEEQDEIAF